MSERTFRLDVHAEGGPGTFPRLALVLGACLLLTLGVVSCGDDDTAAGDPCATQTCSGHGTCTTEDGTAMCTCGIGYDGDTCAACSDGYRRDDQGACVPTESCTADDPCGAHGTCDDTTGVIACVCDPGYDGPFCSTCYPGYHDAGAGECVLDEQCLSNTCDSHGACDDAGGSVVCDCEVGYIGDHCETCDAGYHRDAGENCVADEDCAADDPCGAHGTCDDTTGVIACVCDPGYDGPFCSTCYPGYHDGGAGDCVLDEQCLSNTCDSHGTCDATGGLVVCDCEVGYIGENCETCDATYHRDEDQDCLLNEDCSLADPCGTHGTCDDSTGVITCVCNQGYDGPFCSTCYPGYHDDGTGACVLDEQCLSNTCAGHGTCGDAGGVVVCTCDPGYTGGACEHCDAGYHRDAGDACVADEDCAQGDPCGDHGTCDDSTGVITCVCDSGYTGAHCDACYPGYAVNQVSGFCEIPCQNSQEIRCNGTCVFGGDHDNCGACGNDCGGLVCVSNGLYDFSCGCPTSGWPWELCSPTECAKEDTDPNHCGSCGNACASGETCFDGRCVMEDQGCWCDNDPNFLCCGGSCYDQMQLRQDPNHCGDCDTVCAAGEVCVMGQCTAGDGTCGGPCPDPNNQLCCQGSCRMTWDFQWDPQNCGACGNDCGSNAQCNDGHCGCQQGYADCGAGCTDILADESNCGGCGITCNAGQECVYGVCEPDNSSGCGGSCTTDEYCCSLNQWPWEECVDIAGMGNNADHCGGCDPCAPGEQCSSGQCFCPYMVYGYCNGACTDFEDPQNCGACGNVCAPNEFCQFTGMSAECVCPTMECNGICTDTRFDEANCGDCDVPCASGEACVEGHCVVEDGTGCDPSCADQGVCCDVGGAGQCMGWWDIARDESNCGGCGITCGIGEMCNDGVCGPIPGDDCSAPQPVSEGGQPGLNLCDNTASGFVTSTCALPGDGTQTDRTHVFSPSWDPPGGWQISFMPFGLGTAQAEIWLATPGDDCDNTSTPLGCIDPFGDLTIPAGQAPAGSEIIIYVYTTDDPCSGGDYDLDIHAM